MVIASANNFSSSFPIFRIMIPFSFPIVLAITPSATSYFFVEHKASLGVMIEVFFLVKDLFI